MAALASIILADAAASALTFAPAGISTEGVAMYEDRASGISVGFPKLTVNLRRPNKTSSNYRATVKLVMPVLEQTSPSTATGIQPAPTVAYSITATTELVLPARCSLTDRQNALALVKSALADSVITALVEQYEAIW